MHYQAVLDFWYEKKHQPLWWAKDNEFDQLISDTFSDIHNAAVHAELFEWRVDVMGRLAEIIVLDQFSRNLYRDDSRSWQYDPMSLALAQEAVNQGHDKLLYAQPQYLSFLYMPFMHSESRLIHQTAVELFKLEGLEQQLEFEYKHKQIIDQFGRYPHRNAVLGRQSTAAEIEFLKQPNSGF